MENYIVINGKKAELTEEQLKALGIETEKKSPFDRAKTGDEFYYISHSGSLVSTCEVNANSDNLVHKVANYCTDKNLLRQQAYREILNRLLWRYSMEHDGDKIEWKIPDSTEKYYIVYGCKNGECDVAARVMYKSVGIVYFHTERIAKRAIKEIVEPFMAEHPDFQW